MRSDENGAGGGVTDTGGQFLLPASAGSQMPLIQPRLQTVVFQLDAKPFDGRFVAAVVGQE